MSTNQTLDILPRFNPCEFTGVSMQHFSFSKGECGRLSRSILLATTDRTIREQSKKHRFALECVVYNLIVSAFMEERYGEPCYIAVSRTVSDFKKPPTVYRSVYESAGYDALITVIDSLTAAGFIDQKKGYLSRDLNFSKGVRTRLLPTDKFKALLADFSRDLNIQEFARGGILILKDEKGKLEGYNKLAPAVRSMQSSLDRINTHLRRYKFTYQVRHNTTHTPTHTTPPTAIPEGIETISNHTPSLDDVFVSSTKVTVHPESIKLNRVFKLTFKSGGRFYAAYQSILREERATLLIDGCPAVELDYSSLHPTIVYHLEGLNPAHKPYAVPGIPPEARQAAKKAVLKGLNASSRQKAIQALQQEINFENLNLGGLPSASALFDKMVEGHPQIAQYWFSGEGMRLQYIDSCIAERILLTFVDLNKPCLPVHDSFVVKAEDEELLRETMTKAYREVFFEVTNTPHFDLIPPAIDKKARTVVKTPFIHLLDSTPLEELHRQIITLGA